MGLQSMLMVLHLRMELSEIIDLTIYFIFYFFDSMVVRFTHVFREGNGSAYMMANMGSGVDDFI